MNLENKQSIILNYNPNINNDKAYSYEQSANQLLEIAPNTDVALYKAYLQKKPITIPEDEDVEIVFNSALETYQTILNDYTNNPVYMDLYDITLKNNFKSANISIGKGTYTKGEFINHLSVILDLQLQQLNTATLISSNVATSSLPYITKGNIFNDGSCFLGYVNKYDVSRINHFTTSASNVEATLVNVSTSGRSTNKAFEPNTTPGTPASFVGMDNPLLPYAFVNDSNIKNNDFCQSVMYFDIESPITPSSQAVVQQSFLNTNMTSNLWSAINTPTIDSLSGFPTSLFGVELKSNVSASNFVVDIVTVYHNGIFNRPLLHSNFEEASHQYAFDVLNRGDHKLLDFYNMIESAQYTFRTGFASTNMNKRTIKFGCRVYAVKHKLRQYQSKKSYGKNYYFQILLNMPISGESQVSGLPSNVLYDSRNYGIAIPDDIVETGLFYDMCKSRRDPTDGTLRTCLGLQPYFFFKDCPAGYKLKNITGSVNGTFQRTNLQTGGKAQVLDSYNFNFPPNSVVKNIIGSGGSEVILQKLTDNLYLPALYPTYMEHSSGILNIFGDNIRYNIEIPSLPIKTFNTTSTVDFNLGNERTIIYGTGVFLTGNLNEINNTFVNINIEPNNLKFISLNNNKTIKLNNIKVQIRRAGTNKEATEITDCSIELMIKNPK